MILSAKRWVALFVLVFATVLGATAAESKIRVLIVDGFSNHDWQQTTALIQGILKPSGLFEVAVSTAPQSTNAAGLAGVAAGFSGL